MRTRLLLCCVLAAVLIAPWGVAQRYTPGPGKAIALARPETKTNGRLKVESPEFKDGQPLPEKFSQLNPQGAVSPPLKWSGAPKATQSFAVILEDPDAPLSMAFVHWLVYGIPAGVTELPEGLPAKDKLEKPAGAMQGRGTSRKIGYFGPRPPKSDPPHHYHFQVFALDKAAELKPGATAGELLKEMQGHVIAKGEIVGTFQIR